MDRANLGTQAKREFDAFAPGGAGLLFREEVTVQHLQGSAIDPSASVVISTVQRLYSVLRGQPFDDADDERGGFERAADNAERPVTYNPAIPPETFDLIIVDECHRSIYGNWRQLQLCRAGRAREAGLEPVLAPGGGRDRPRQPAPAGRDRC